MYYFDPQYKLQDGYKVIGVLCTRIHELGTATFVPYFSLYLFDLSSEYNIICYVTLCWFRYFSLRIVKVKVHPITGSEGPRGGVEV
jgi:hypothetical protein